MMALAPKEGSPGWTQVSVTQDGSDRSEGHFTGGGKVGLGPRRKGVAHSRADKIHVTDDRILMKFYLAGTAKSAAPCRPGRGDQQRLGAPIACGGGYFLKFEGGKARPGERRITRHRSAVAGGHNRFDGLPGSPMDLALVGP